MSKLLNLKSKFIKEQKNSDSEISDAAGLALTLVQEVISGMRQRLKCESIDDDLNPLLIASYLHPSYKEMLFAGKDATETTPALDLSGAAKLKVRELLERQFADCKDPVFLAIRDEPVEVKGKPPPGVSFSTSPVYSSLTSVPLRRYLLTVHRSSRDRRGLRCN